MATIRKRGNSWNVQVRRKGETPLSATFDTKVQAEAWARKVEHEIDSGQFVPVQLAKSITVADLLLKYAEEVAPTKKSHRWIVSRVGWMVANTPFAGKPVPDLATKDLQNWRDTRLKEVKSSTVNRDINLLSSMFSHAMQEWSVPLRVNPMSLLKRPKDPPSRTGRWSDSDLKKVCDYFGGTEKPPTTFKSWVPFIMELSVETAMRRGELFSLLVEDVDLKRRVATLHTTKNGEPRGVPLSSKAVELLKAMVGKRKHGKVLPLSKPYFGGLLWLAFKELGLSHLHFHDTRREATTRLASKLPNVVELSLVTGHKDLRCLAIYYKPSAEELAEKLK